MTAGPETLAVVVLADGDVREPLHDVLRGLGCTVTAADDLFDGVAKVEREDPDAVVVDLTSSRDDPRALAHWVSDNGFEAKIVGLVDAIAGVADSDLEDICDELVLAPATNDSVAAALGLQRPATDEQDRRLTVKIHAALYDQNHAVAPPAEVADGEESKPGLIVGLGAHAEAPRFNDD